MIAFLFHHLPARAAFSSYVDHRGLLAHDPREAGSVVAKAGRVTRQEAVRISEKRLEGIRILPSVMPGKNAAIRDDGMRKAHLHEVVAKVDAMAHPLVGDAARELSVETKFKVKLRIERSVGLGHQPSAPIGVLFANHFYLRAPPPARPVIVPHNLILGDITKYTGADQIAHGTQIRFAAVLRA